MKKLFYAAFAYMVLGVLSGLFYREFTKANHFSENAFTQLAVVHTHLLVLGFIVLLIVLLLEKVFTLSKSPLFSWFFWVYNAGLLVTAGMMVVHGSLTVLGQDSGSGMSAIAGIAGMGHILLSIALVLLFLALGSRIMAETKKPVAAGSDGAAGADRSAGADAAAGSDRSAGADGAAGSDRSAGADAAEGVSQGVTAR
ncbi:DUF2871 domain-containing protein [Rathayibacter soli]|uniref:DUF2871 domain-containing protein n=1 Tax=Rathayibacter soli TaxID=3144168 RepID=UPI0027E4E78F|nr:DUF2871 domain-containing protein [Glaciibacter superstes]